VPHSRKTTAMSCLMCTLQTPTKRRSQQRPGRPPKPSAAAALAAAQACGEPPPLLRHPARTSQQRGPSPLSIPPEHAGSSHDSSRPPAGTSDGTNQDSFSGSLVETVAQLGELHAELEAGHARVQAAVAGEALAPASAPASSS
jgi:hypothetical protein